MASAVWGNVYFKDIYAGILKEEPDGSYVFTYDESYVNSRQQAISHSLPLSPKPYVSKSSKLHPFFDNLISEGWLGDVQAEGINTKDRFARLLRFGYDLMGAVSITDPEPVRIKSSHDTKDKAEIAALKGRASAGGFQKKLLVIKDGKQYRPAGSDELSTHIAKFASKGDSTATSANQIEIEYLSTLAVSRLLPTDETVYMEITTIKEVGETALVIQRFDRSNGKRIHFEEFNQLLGRYSYNSEDKYNGAYKDMAEFINDTPHCLKTEIDVLFRRILACLVISNTDAHLKNFAMFHTTNGLRLTPIYDILAVPMWNRKFNTIALSIGGVKDMRITDVKPKHLLLLGKDFGLTEEVIISAINDLDKHLPDALRAVENSNIGTNDLRKRLIKKIEARWKGSFALTGQTLSARQSKGD